MLDYRKLLSMGDEGLQLIKKHLRPSNSEVVGDLAAPAIKKTLPDVEAEVIKNRALPNLVEEIATSPVADDVVEQAAKKSMKDNANTVGKGVLALGATGAAIKTVNDLLGLSDPPEQQDNAGVMLPVINKEEKAAPKKEQPNTIQTNKESLKVKTSSAPVAAKTAVEQEPPIQPEETVDDYETRLAAARQKDADKGLLFGLLKAAQMGGSAMAGSKADTSFADSELAKSDEFTQKFTQDEKLKQERLDILDEKKLKDPNSAESVYMREQMAKIGFPVNASISAADLKKQGINLSNLLTQKMAIDSRKEAAALQREMLSASREEKKEERKNNELVANVAKWSKEASSQPAYKRFQENQEAYVYADKIAKGQIDLSGVDDGALILQAVKLAQADSSVVRDSDQRLFNSVGGLKQDAQELTQKLMGGKRLTPETRQAYVEMMLRARDNLAQSAKEQTSHLYSKFQKAGVPEDEIPGTLLAINKMTANKKENNNSEVKRLDPKSGKTAVFDAQTKKFLRYE